MCAPHPIDPRTANIRPPALAPIETAVPPEEETGSQDSQDSQEPAANPGNPGNPGNPVESAALRAMGYRVEEDAAGGRFAFSLETPYEGATIQAGMGPRGGSGRVWSYCCGVLNNRGIGWSATGELRDTSRWVAKKLLVALALEMRKQYCHRSQKIRKRSIARAIARRQAEEAAHA